VKKLISVSFIMFLSFGAHAVEDEGEYSPAISPDGKLIAFHVNNETNAWDIAIRNIKTGEENLVTSSSDFDVDASWSPDGKRLAFASTRGGDWNIYIYTLATGETTGVITRPGIDNQPKWSPDGQRLVFTSRRNGSAQLYLYDFTSSETSQLTDTDKNIAHPSWASDMKSVVFDQYDGEKSSIYIVDTDTKQVSALYSGHGSTIAAKLIKDDLFVSNNRRGNWDLLKINLKTGSETSLAASEFDEMKADINLNHHLYAYSAQDKFGVFRLVFSPLKAD